MTVFTLKHPAATMEHLGLIPAIISAYDPRPIAEQVNENYAHGGGWKPFEGFTVAEDASSIRYQDEPPRALIAEAEVNDEVFRLYDGAWASVTQPDGSVEISRMD